MKELIIYRAHPTTGALVKRSEIEGMKTCKWSGFIFLGEGSSMAQFFPEYTKGEFFAINIL